MTEDTRGLPFMCVHTYSTESMGRGGRVDRIPSVLCKARMVNTKGGKTVSWRLKGDMIRKEGQGLLPDLSA